MIAKNPLVPEGIRHTLDLSTLTPAELDSYHIKQLRSGMFQQARGFSEAYRQEYPEAEKLLTLINTRAFKPKPAGYYPAWRRLVGLWLTDETAAARTQGQDVDWLNSELGTSHFDRNRFLSKALSATERRHAAELFADRGLALPDTVKNKADVKRAAKAMKAKGRPGSKPFGNIGTRTGETLTIGTETFRVQRLSGREFVRVSIGGTRRRLYLDELLLTADWLAGLLTGALGETTGDPLPSYTCIDGEVATCRVSAVMDPLDNPPGEQSPREVANENRPSSGELATGDSLSARIARLSAARRPTPDEPRDPNIDPLEL